MANYREIRKAKGLQARQVAEAAGIDPTMFSRFENYRVLPVPDDFRKVLRVLGCTASDIYTPDEVLLLPGTVEVKMTGGARAHVEPAEYKMTVRLDNECRATLTREVLQKCGYSSIGAWITACIRQLKQRYDELLKEKRRPTVPCDNGGTSEG